MAPRKQFSVTMRPTEASERCRLRGSYTLRAGENALELWSGPELGTQLYEWPYRFLRRFGRDKVSRGCCAEQVERKNCESGDCQREGKGSPKEESMGGGREG